jgi:hypothetical protein
VLLSKSAHCLNKTVKRTVTFDFPISQFESNRNSIVVASVDPSSDNWRDLSETRDP